MNDKLREWICNTCKYPCTLIVHVEDCTPDSCPYSCERFEGWKLLESHEPKHETVEHQLSEKDKQILSMKCCGNCGHVGYHRPDNCKLCKRYKRGNTVDNWQQKGESV